MKILFVISSLAAGGAQRVIIDLTARLVAVGNEVILVTYSDTERDHFETPKGVQRIALNLLWKSQGLIHSFRSNLLRVRILRAAIRNAKPDIVVSFIDLTNVLTLVSAFGLGIPVVISERIHPRFHEIPLHWRIARRLVYPLCDALVVQTKGIAEWAWFVTGCSRVHIIPNAIPDREWIHGVPREPLLLAVGRLHRQKGFDLLIDAFCASGLPECWRLAILGDGPERASLSRQATERGVAERIEFLGEVRDPERWMARASLFVLSSRFEGFPNVLLEAIAANVPIVSFDCPTGPADLLAYGGGLLVKNGDVSGLAKAIARVASDSFLREELACQGKAAKGAFTQERVTGHWIDLLSRLSAKRRQ